MSDDGNTETTFRMKGWVFYLAPTYHGVVHGFPGETAKKDRPIMPHPHFTVAIKANTQYRRSGGELPRGPEVFDFYASAHDAEQGKTHLNRLDLADVLKCVLSDALAGYDTFEDFQREFGYTDCREAFRIYSACQESRQKVERLGLNEDSAITVVNHLIDAANADRVI